MILSESHEIGIPNVELVSDGENWYVVNGSGNIKEYSLLLDKPLPIWLLESDDFFMKQKANLQPS